MTNQILVLLVLAAIFTSGTAQGYAQPLKERLHSKIEFVDALKIARSVASKLVNLSPEAMAEEFSGNGYYNIPAPGNSDAVAQEKDGIYTYVWGNFYGSKKFSVKALVVEFYSGGLWFQVGSKKYLYDPKTLTASENPNFKTPAIYWLNPSTNNAGRLSPNSVNSSLNSEIKTPSFFLGEILELNYKIKKYTDTQDKNKTKGSGAKNETDTLKTESKQPE